MSPPRKSIQAINQDKPAARSNCSIFVILSRGGIIIMTTHIGISPHLTSPVGNPSWPSPREGTSYSANQHQPPPNLPRRGGTDTLDCQWLIRLGVTCISPTGENERGLMMITGVMMTNGVTVHHLFSFHLASPVGEGQIHLTA